MYVHHISPIVLFVNITSASVYINLLPDFHIVSKHHKTKLHRMTACIDDQGSLSHIFVAVVIHYPATLLPMQLAHTHPTMPCLTRVCLFMNTVEIRKHTE